MPSVFSTTAKSAAHGAGFEDFKPDACLINRYLPGARLTLHQDKRVQQLRQIPGIGALTLLVHGARSALLAAHDGNWSAEAN